MQYPNSVKWVQKRKIKNINNFPEKFEQVFNFNFNII